MNIFAIEPWMFVTVVVGAPLGVLFVYRMLFGWSKS
jgi:hypothetical protein